MHKIIEEGLDGRQGKKRPKRRQTASFGPYEVCLFFNVQNFNFIVITTAHEGPQQPTKANEGQRRSTKAHSSQRRPTKTKKGPKRRFWRRLGPRCVFFFFFSFFFQQ